MKTFKFSLLSISLLALIFFACQKDASDAPSITSNATSVSNVPALACCVDDFSETLTPLYSCGDEANGYLVITAENTATGIIVHINRTGDLNANQPNSFNRVEWSILNNDGTTVLGSGNTEGDENAPKTEYSFTYTSSSNLIGCTNYKIGLVIKGLKGFDGNNADLQCDRMRGENGKGVFEGTFPYTVMAQCVTSDCSLSQGYWFAKPQTVWTGLTTAKVYDGKVLVGGKEYTQAEGKAIFFMSCQSAGKLGFQQVSTIYLSVANGNLAGVPSALTTDINTVETFLAGKPKLTTSNACTSTFASKAVQSAAGRIGDWIDAHHCSE